MCPTNLITAEELTAGMSDPAEPVDAVYLNFSKAADSVCLCLPVKKIVAMGIHLKLTHWLEEFLKNRTLIVNLGVHRKIKLW